MHRSPSLFRLLPVVGIAGLLLVLAARLGAYFFEGPRWATGANIVMNLQLGSSSGALIDGSASWGASAEDALSIWNNLLGSGVHFSVVRDSTVPISYGDGANSVFFSKDVFGSPFGSDVLAVTKYRYTGGSATAGTLTEADVVFNSAVAFNSYRGPLRRAAGGGTLYDFHRVALHEFGHVLGLDHPDQHAQSVSAQMNANTTDLDSLTADDIAGVQVLYGGAAPTPTPTPAPTGPVAVSVVGAGATRGGFVVSRTGSVAAAVTILYHNGGSALRDIDYQALPGTVTLAAGQSETIIPVRLLPGANRSRKVKVLLDPSGTGAYSIAKSQSKVFLSDL